MCRLSQGEGRRCKEWWTQREKKLVKRAQTPPHPQWRQVCSNPPPHAAAVFARWTGCVLPLVWCAPTCFQSVKKGQRTEQNSLGCQMSRKQVSLQTAPAPSCLSVQLCRQQLCLGGHGPVDVCRVGWEGWRDSGGASTSVVASRHSCSSPCIPWQCSELVGTPSHSNSRD